MKILRGIDKSLDVMRTADICDNAGISRRTFYRHFTDKYAIAPWFLSYCANCFLGSIGQSVSWEAGYYGYLRSILRERDTLHKALGYSINDPFKSTPYSCERLRIFLEALNARYGAEPDERMRFLAETFAKLEYEMICDWLRSESPVDLGRQVERMVGMVPPRLYQALDILGYENGVSF